MSGSLRAILLAIMGICAGAGVLYAGGSGGESDGAGDELVVGFIYVGPADDFGYNQAHAEGADAVKQIPGVTVLEEELVPETVEVQGTMRSMIELDGADILFPTSFGYFDPHIVEVAPDYEDVFFYHAGGLYREGVHPANVASYFGYIFEGQYLNGIAAGHASKTGKLGFIGAIPIPQVLENINAFTLGARSVNPEITTTVIFTGGWSDPVAEANAANSLIDQGVDVITMHVDSPKVIVQTAEERGIYTAGYHANQFDLAPRGYLTGAEWNWPGIYTRFVTTFMEGSSSGNFIRGGFQEGFIKMSPFGPSVSDEAKQSIAGVKARMEDGDFVIFRGPLSDNEGNLVIPEGVELPTTDPKLEEMDYLVEGVIGSTGF